MMFYLDNIIFHVVWVVMLEFSLVSSFQISPATKIFYIIFGSVEVSLVVPFEEYEQSSTIFCYPLLLQPITSGRLMPETPYCMISVHSVRGIVSMMFLSLISKYYLIRISIIDNLNIAHIYLAPSNFG